MIDVVSGKKLKFAGITMKFPRRKFLHFATVAAAFPSLIGNARSSDYPVRPVHIVVPFPPGGVLGVEGDFAGTTIKDSVSATAKQPPEPRRALKHPKGK
jgi:hypothetical protein